jgi:HK97 family phage major capsid protein
MTKTIKKGKQFRTLELTYENGSQREADDGETIIRVAVSSEEPVPRPDGLEILDHSPEAVDLTRLRNAAAFLVDHNPADQVGVISNPTIDDDRVLRADVRFSKSQRGQEIMQDMLDGIRQKISVGYWPLQIVRDRNTSDASTYRVTSWMPFEVSTVAIPADDTVGVGRASEETRDCEVCEDDEEESEVRQPLAAEADATAEEAKRKKEEAVEASPEVVDGQRSVASSDTDTTTMKNKDEVTPVVTVGDDLSATATERAIQIAELAREHGFTQRTAEWLKSGRSVDAIAKEILNMKSNNEVTTADPVANMSARDQKSLTKYSIVRAINKLADNKALDGLEAEVNQEWEKQMGRAAQGFWMPTSTRAALDSATSTKGAEDVFVQPAGFIDYLRNRTQVLKLGAQYIGGASSKLTLVRQNGTGGASWVAENGSGVSQTNMTFDTVTLSPKTLMSAQAFSRQLLTIGEYDVQGIVMNDITRAFAVALDAAALAGSGAANDPTGLVSASGVNLVALHPSGSGINYTGIVGMESAVATANADVDEMAYIFTPGVYGNLKTTLKASGSIEFILGEGGTVNGFKAVRSNNVPSNCVKGAPPVTGLHAAFFGDWSALTIATFGAVEIIVDPYASKNKGLIEVTGLLMADVAVRTPQSFARILDIIKQ